MKTARWLKLSALLHGVFLCICSVCSACFLLFRITGGAGWLTAGRRLLFFWLLNPVGPVTLGVGLAVAFSERSEPDQKAEADRLFPWIAAGFGIVTLAWLTSAAVWLLCTLLP